MCFSDRLVKLRKLKGMTQNELAKKAGITTRALQNYELGVRVPKDEYIFKLSKALGVTSNALENDSDFKIEIAKQKTLNHIDLSNSTEIISGIIATGLSISLTKKLSLPFSIPIALGSSLIAIFTTMKNSKLNKNAILNLYKERVRIERNILVVNEHSNRFQEKYEQLTNQINQENISIDECKEILNITERLTEYLSNCREYIYLLEQKNKYCKQLITYIEDDNNCNDKISTKLLLQIQKIQEREAKYEKVLYSENEKEE